MFRRFYFERNGMRTTMPESMLAQSSYIKGLIAQLRDEASDQHLDKLPSRMGGVEITHLTMGNLLSYCNDASRVQALKLRDVINCIVLGKFLDCAGPQKIYIKEFVRRLAGKSHQEMTSMLNAAQVPLPSPRLRLMRALADCIEQAHVPSEDVARKWLMDVLQQAAQNPYTPDVWTTAPDPLECSALIPRIPSHYMGKFAKILAGMELPAVTYPSILARDFSSVTSDHEVVRATEILEAFTARCTSACAAYRALLVGLSDSEEITHNDYKTFTKILETHCAAERELNKFLKPIDNAERYFAANEFYLERILMAERNSKMQILRQQVADIIDTNQAKVEHFRARLRDIEATRQFVASAVSWVGVCFPGQLPYQLTCLPIARVDALAALLCDTARELQAAPCAGQSLRSIAEILRQGKLPDLARVKVVLALRDFLKGRRNDDKKLASGLDELDSEQYRTLTGLTCRTINAIQDTILQCPDN